MWVYTVGHTKLLSIHYVFSQYHTVTQALVDIPYLLEIYLGINPFKALNFTYNTDHRHVRNHSLSTKLAGYERLD